ncbi:hypothetical protein MMC32_007993 [Xylographa parallela]|nr:hypothetical protein [Xylographa parallela]
MCRLTQTHLTVPSVHSPPNTCTKSYIAYCAFLCTCPIFRARQRIPQTVAAAALEVQKTQEERREGRVREESEDRGACEKGGEKSGLDGDVEEEEEWEPDPVRLEGLGTLIRGDGMCVLSRDLMDDEYCKDLIRLIAEEKGAGVLLIAGY